MQASEEQKGWWLDKARTMKIIVGKFYQKNNEFSGSRKINLQGSYAQTELGHGSNVRGLQTVAVYDKTTQEFVLSTPNLMSMKWWPGETQNKNFAIAQVSNFEQIFFNHFVLYI